MSNLDNFLQQAAAFRAERERVIAERLKRLEGLPCEMPETLFDDGRMPKYPWVWYRNQLVVLRPDPNAELPNHLGGTDGARWKGLAKGCKPYLLLDLCPESLPFSLPASSPVRQRLPLFHPLKCSAGPEMLYRVERDGSLKATQSPAAKRGDRDWPYEGYPDSLPQCGLAVDGPYAMPFLALFPSHDSHAFSVQDLPEDGDQFLIAMVTTNEATLGVSLLGPDAEAEGAQILFLVSPETGAVWTYNQCG